VHFNLLQKLQPKACIKRDFYEKLLQLPKAIGKYFHFFKKTAFFTHTILIIECCYA